MVRISQLYNGLDFGRQVDVNVKDDTNAIFIHFPLALTLAPDYLLWLKIAEMLTHFVELPSRPKPQAADPRLRPTPPIRRRSTPPTRLAFRKILGRKGPLAHLLCLKENEKGFNCYLLVGNKYLLSRTSSSVTAFELYTYCCNSINLIYEHISIGFNEYPRSFTVDIIIFFFKTVDI
nr:hypothetical protein CFP56_49298 [Quercus suber]